MYKAYKKLALSNMHNLNALYNTGSYSRPAYAEMVEDVKLDILEFSKEFEEKLQAEIRKDLEDLHNS